MPRALRIPASLTGLALAGWAATAGVATAIFVENVTSVGPRASVAAALALAGAAVWRAL